MLKQFFRNWEGDLKIIKIRVLARHVVKLLAYNAVGFDNWVVLQKINSSYYVEAVGTMDP